MTSRNQREGRYGGHRQVIGTHVNAPTIIGRHHVRASGFRRLYYGVQPLTTSLCDGCGGQGGAYVGYAPDDYWWEDCGSCCGHGRI